MKLTKYFKIAAVAVPFILVSCRGQISEKEPVHPNMNMDQQERFEGQEENPFFEDNRSMRQPVEGTIARGNLREDPAYYQGINEDSSFVDEIPVDVTRSFLHRGQEQYNIYCNVCHGRTGDGRGIIMTGQYGYVPAPTFHSDRLRDMNDGQIYSAIANGVRTTMPSYAHQVKVEDRWAIVAYIRALQRSQYVPENEMEQFDVDLAALQEQHAEQMAAQEEAEEGESTDEDISAERGKVVYEENQCQTCHSLDGSDGIGPTHQGIWEREETLEDGSTVTVDEEYLRESIVEPNAKIVEGYNPGMASYSFLSDAEIESLVEFMKTLSDNE